jgi:hypothetical protein
MACLIRPVAALYERQARARKPVPRGMAILAMLSAVRARRLESGHLSAVIDRRYSPWLHG